MPPYPTHDVKAPPPGKHQGGLRAQPGGALDRPLLSDAEQAEAGVAGGEASALVEALDQPRRATVAVVKNITAFIERHTPAVPRPDTPETRKTNSIFARQFSFLNRMMPPTQQADETDAEDSLPPTPIKEKR